MTRPAVQTLALLATVAVPVIACTDLERLPEGTCGNTVVEAGEDCDVHVPPGLGAELACVPPGDPARQCRLDCRSGCPDGWACGPDDICVHGTGSLVEAAGSPFELGGDALSLADVDGDGRADVLGALPDAVRVLFGDPAGGLRDGSSRHLAGSSSSAPVVADVTDDGRADLLAPSALGVEVLRGDAGRTMSPVAYAPYWLAGFDHARLVPMRAADYAPEDSLLLIGSAGSEIDLWVVPIPFPMQLPALRIASTRSVAELPDRLAVADLDGDDLDDLALVWPGEDAVRVLETAEGGLPGASVVIERVRLALPSPASGTICFADVDGDGSLDLVAQLANGEIAVARGDGSGALADFALDDRFAALPAGDALLAAGAIDADAAADFVTSSGVYLQDGPGLRRSDSTPLGQTFAAALIYDHTGDGRPDVAATTMAPTGVQLLIGSGTGEFTIASVTTAGEPFAPRAADIDGDGVADLAFAVRGAAGSGDDAMVWFGTKSGAPGAPVRVAQLATIEHLEVAHLRDTRGLLDSAHDLVVSLAPERPGVRRLAFLAGSPWRELSSPFVLRSPSATAAEPPDEPHVVAAGRFDGPDLPPGWIALASVGGERRLWLVPGAPEARFSLDDVRWIPRADVPGLPDSSPDLWLTGDVDGDARDELVWLASEGGALAVAIADVDIATGGLTATAIALEGLGRPLRGYLDDVDRDGAIDLLVTFDGGAALYTGGPSRWPATRLVLDAEDAVVVNLDADARRELALIRNGRVELAELEGTPPSEVLARPGGTDAPGTHLLLGGDVDGDGIPDLIAGDGARVRVFRVQRHTEAELPP